MVEALGGGSRREFTHETNVRETPMSSYDAICSQPSSACRKMFTRVYTFMR